uniref:NFACT RNA-binding domain-containing protein n=1 Tax=Heterosigma akashiwo TaxID=2829 RepID=A0A7S3XPB0_HETAK
MAARSNLILVNAETGSIATCAYQVSPSKSTRPLQTGQQYELPPPQAKAAPAPGAPSLPEFKATVGLIGTDRLASALVSLYKGVSPVLAKGMARAAGLSPNAQVDSLTEEQWEALYSGPWTQWLKVLVENENSQASIDFENFAFQPIIFNDNEAKDLSPHTQKMDLLKAVEDYYGLAQITVEHNRLKQKCLAKVAAALKKARDRQAEFSSRLAEVEAGSARDLEGQADLLTAYTHTWKDGDAEIQCQDFETGEPITITVPTGTTPVEMAQKMYTKSKKLKRSVETVTPLLDQANLLVEYLEGVEFSIFDIETCKSQEDLLAIQEIADELDAEGSGFVQNHLLYINSGLTGRSSSQKTENMSQKKKAQKSQKGKLKKNTKGEAGRQQKGQKPSKKDLSLDGFLKLQRSPSSPVLLVGRNSQQNERLSFKVAREHDVWLHVRGVPGSHCLLRLEPGRDPSPEDLRHAADVAAYHSKARGSSNVPVMYTSPANVKKISGGPPGMVHLMREEVIWADPGRVA